MLHNNADSLKKLNAEYEDALFRIIMSEAAEREGRLIYEEYMKSKTSHEVPQKEYDRFYALLDSKLKIEKRNRRIPTKILFKTTAAVLAIIIMCSVLMVNVEAFRLKVLNLLISIEPRYTSIQISDSDGSNLIVDWKSAYVPTYIPEGFKLERVSSSSTAKLLYFIKEDDKSTITYMECGSTYGIAIDTEGASLIEEIEISGHKGTLSVKGSTTTVAWIIDDRLFSIQGQADTDEIIKMAESVKFFK